MGMALLLLLIPLALSADEAAAMPLTLAATKIQARSPQGDLLCLSRTQGLSVAMSECVHGGQAKWTIGRHGGVRLAMTDLCLASSASSGVGLAPCGGEGALARDPSGHIKYINSKTGEQECLVLTPSSISMAPCSLKDPSFDILPIQTCTMTELGIGGCQDANGKTAGGLLQLAPGGSNSLASCLLDDRCSAVETDTGKAYAEGVQRITQTGKAASGKCYARRCGRVSSSQKPHVATSTPAKISASNEKEEPNKVLDLDNTPCNTIAKRRGEWICCKGNKGFEYKRAKDIDNFFLCNAVAVKGIAQQNGAVSMWAVASSHAKAFNPQLLMKPKVAPAADKIGATRRKNCAAKCKPTSVAPWCCCPPSKCAELPGV